MSHKESKHAGTIFARCLRSHGVKQVFTLTGGHIAPILLGCHDLKIDVVDVRDEVTAVFAADAVSRLTGIPGVAVVTAGPGLTNTITAVKNASMAQSPIVIFGGSSATLLRGRGALQDINQLELMKPLVKWSFSVSKVSQIVGVVKKAFAEALSGVPGPVFIETPLDVIWPKEIVAEEMLKQSKETNKSIFTPSGLTQALTQAYIRYHVTSMFAGLEEQQQCVPVAPRVQLPSSRLVAAAATYLTNAKRPVIVIGSQALAIPQQAAAIRSSIEKIGSPCFLGGMARGLLGKGCPLHFVHNRSHALKLADLVVLVGLPQDFRLGYGRQIPATTTVVSSNRSDRDLTLNRTPSLPVKGDAGKFLIELAKHFRRSESSEGSDGEWAEWIGKLREADDRRCREIDAQASQPVAALCNPLAVVSTIEKHLTEDSIIIADGGDFVGTASYVLRPRAPLTWLDPGPFGTLGVGGGFAIGAGVAKKGSEVWLLYGDGSSAYSLAEFDTYRRHNIPVIAVIGNDAAWMQMKRGQVDFFDNDVATSLEYTDYQDVAVAYGGGKAVGFVVKEIAELEPAIIKAKENAKQGLSSLINVHIASSSFRKDSISV